MHEDYGMDEGSPFFPEPIQPEGLSPEEINLLPTMVWGTMH
jgi:hypothetical protein